MPKPLSRKPATKQSRRSAIQAEIAQRKPFGSLAQEATIALLRTASVVRRAIARVVEPSGLSLAQYNALRIVRGAGAGGIATLAIRDRMIEEGTTITRLLDKLDEAGLIRRERSFPDRRQVTCYTTDAGRKLLDRLDPRVDERDAEATAALTDDELESFIGMLDTIRAANAARGAARSSAARAESVRPEAVTRGPRPGVGRPRRRPAAPGASSR
jgi:MarR family transcriptional regulator, organic hydroperoxide resistance regulator